MIAPEDHKGADASWSPLRALAEAGGDDPSFDSRRELLRADAQLSVDLNRICDQLHRGLKAVEDWFVLAIQVDARTEMALAGLPTAEYPLAGAAVDGTLIVGDRVPGGVR